LKSVRILLLPKGDVLQYGYYPGVMAYEYFDPVKTLKSFRILRNVAKLEILTAEGMDLLLQVQDPDWSLTTAHDLPPEFEEELRTVVQDSTPALHIWKMYETLVRYTQALKRNERYRDEMMPRMGEAKALLRRRSKQWTWSDRLFSEIEYCQSPFEGPKTQDSFHPVEDALEYASYASELNRLQKFRKARSTLLHLAPLP
jgi:hypothetical protein